MISRDETAEDKRRLEEDMDHLVYNITLERNKKKATEEKAIVLNKDQIEMLLFLRAGKSSKGNPLNLETAYDLHNQKKRETYNDYMELVQMKCIDSDPNGFWITEQGLEALKNLHSKPK